MDMDIIIYVYIYTQRYRHTHPLSPHLSSSCHVTCRAVPSLVLRNGAQSPEAVARAKTLSEAQRTPCLELGGPLASSCLELELAKKNRAGNEDETLVGGLDHCFYDFPYTGNFIIPTDEVIFFRGAGRYTTNQNMVKPSRNGNFVGLGWVNGGIPKFMDFNKVVE